MSELTGNGCGVWKALEADASGTTQQDQDELYFEEHPMLTERIRLAIPGEWPEINELHTSPPYTLVIQIRPGLLLKLGSWKRAADTHNTILQLNQGRLAIAAYLERQELNPLSTNCGSVPQK
jgi:hypothetical protein